MRYYAIKFNADNRFLIAKFTDTFEDDYEDYKNYWFVVPTNRPWKSWETLNGYGMCSRFPDADQSIPIQVVSD